MMNSRISQARALLLLALAGSSTVAAAQAPAAAPPAPPATTPAEAPATTEPSAPATEAVPKAPEGTVPAEAALTSEPPAADAESQEIRRRAHIVAVLARGRAQRAAAMARVAERTAQEREPQRHGDAGAALALGFSVDAPFYTDPGYDVFAEDDVGRRYGLWAAYDLLSLRTDTIAALELGWGTESYEEGGIAGALSSALESHAFHGGVQVRWVPIDFLQPHVRLAGGVAVLHMELDATTEHFEDDGISPFGSAGLGVMLRTPTRAFEDRRGNLASLSFGLMVEGGYTLTGALDFKLDGPGPRKGNISLSEADLGELDRSGPYVRVSLVGRI